MKTDKQLLMEASRIIGFYLEKKGFCTKFDDDRAKEIYDLINERLGLYDQKRAISTDGELLSYVQLALSFVKSRTCPDWFFHDWNPLEKNNDAFTLMTALNIQVFRQGDSIITCTPSGIIKERGTLNEITRHDMCDMCAATRRAIVCAAADMGKIWKQEGLANEHEINPRKALNDAITWNCETALDPAVSTEAVNLINNAIERFTSNPVAWLYNGKLYEVDPSAWATGEVIPLFMKRKD